ncbi:hypothetical protein FXO37_10183 [Capsicum annuum]|nr:hypothetical protein FXO37_10183 [Capsicum annuum]
MVQLSESLHSLASVGMAFDYQQNDWLVLRILCVELMSIVPNHIEMYSTRSGRWKKLKNEMFFVFLSLLAMQLLKGYLIGWFVELGGFTLYVRLGSQRRLPYSVGTSFRFDQVLVCLKNGDIVAKNDNFTMQ